MQLLYNTLKVTLIRMKFLVHESELSVLMWYPLFKVQQMKAQNKEEKLAKQQEREKLQREIAAREKAERIQAEYEDKLNRMHAEMEMRQKALLDAQTTIKQLEEQLKETQVSRIAMFPYLYSKTCFTLPKTTCTNCFTKKLPVFVSQCTIFVEQHSVSRFMQV